VRVCVCVGGGTCVYGCGVYGRYMCVWMWCV